MANYKRKDYSLGWMPGVDSVNGPENGLLRADNLIHDEQGILSLRGGSFKINSSPLSSTDIHSLYTVNLNGTRYRMVGAGSDIFANGSTLSQSMSGTGDVSFASYMG